MAPQATAAGRQGEMASGSAMGEGLRNNGGQNSLRSGTAGWILFNYVH